MKPDVPVRISTETVDGGVQLPFVNRKEAGSLLGARLADRTFAGTPIVLALARGGVPVGAAIAEGLRAPLDIVVVRKLGVPWQPELAMGALAGDVRVLDQRLVRAMGISAQEVESIAAREQAQVELRERLYREGRPAPDPRGHDVILVDDGLATGSTMLAAVRYVRTLRAGKVMVAVPVGSAEACGLLSQEADDCLCLATPELFFAVGEWYRDFQQVSDEEVRELLARSAERIYS
jgi:putative phosphoribosyl transferase